MHIIIGVITAIAGLIWALNSLQNAGVNLNSFNPFAWLRRRKWEKSLGTKPMHSLTNSMEVAALLIVSVAKEVGEITRDTKLEILRMFESQFGISKGQSLDLFSVSSYMLKDVMNMELEIKNVLAPSKTQFMPEQTEKLLSMMTQVASFEHEPTKGQTAIIQAVQKEFKLDNKMSTQW